MFERRSNVKPWCKGKSDIIYLQLSLYHFSAIEVDYDSCVFSILSEFHNWSLILLDKLLQWFVHWILNASWT